MPVGSEDLAVEMEQRRLESPLTEPAQILQDYLHRVNLAVGWESWPGHRDMMGGLQEEYLSLPSTCTENRFIITKAFDHTRQYGNLPFKTSLFFPM